MEKGIIGDLGERVGKGASFILKAAAVATYPISGNFSNTLKQRVEGVWPAFNARAAQQASYFTNLVVYGAAAFLTYQSLPYSGVVTGQLIAGAFGLPAVVETLARVDIKTSREPSEHAGSLVGIAVSIPLEYALDRVPERPTSNLPTMA